MNTSRDSLDDFENQAEVVDFTQPEYNDNDWEDILPEESISQVATTSTEAETKSSVWSYFDQDPEYCKGFNVCKICKHKYQLTTGVSSLRKHLKKHDLLIPTKQRIFKVITIPFNAKEKEAHDEYLIRWLICDLQPFTIVDNPYFRAMINYFCPQY